MAAAVPQTKVEVRHAFKTDHFKACEGGHLSAEEKASFERDGFLRMGKLLSDEHVELLRTRLTHLVEHLSEQEGQLHEVEAAWKERPDEVVLHFLGAWRVDPVFHDLVAHPSICHRVQDALGCGGLRLWHDQVFAKPPKHPGVVPWHTDWSYWTRTTPQAHATVFVALDDMDQENGALEYVAGSQSWGDLPKVSFGGHRDQLMSHLSPEQRSSFTPSLQPLRAGEALLHHARTVHGSGPNLSSRPRRAVVLNYMSAATTCAVGGELLAGAGLHEEGEVVRGDHFPILIPPEELERGK